GPNAPRAEAQDRVERPAPGGLRRGGAHAARALWGERAPGNALPLEAGPAARAGSRGGASVEIAVRQARARESRGGRAMVAYPGATVCADRLRPLNRPRPIHVEADERGSPVAV